MKIYNKIKKGKTKESKKGKAVVLLKTVREGILAEKALLKKGYAARKVAPPPEYRKGCEVAVEIDLIKKEEIVKILIEYGIETQGIVPL
jgi:hypothetical protein